jgi:hypothetical protein
LRSFPECMNTTVPLVYAGDYNGTHCLNIEQRITLVG